MSKVYSNKALPPGTVLREWCLEEVLGVGGFGIVYKARGIYFDELVAIKEYFPSAISERQEDDTIVPVDSDAEEVHALGLKKFVEEAKLLWNLSTPSRHPNIVSVRSLFEVHGSAYMVMDFEDGVSLSKLLKEGKRFNQASLAALIHPIAEGLERAHRVGVLHRDIKPANILVGHDDRPVLIDFGSARFESGEATSTTVTFHTPPYAAIEQYVKTYEQGPWTDVYALGVVLYECVTGGKPAEVLERLHGNADKPLLDGDWPGFSRPFLAAIDAAMAIRPDERPRSISEWLALFDRSEDELPPPRPAADDDEATRIAPIASSPDQIQPVAPPAPGFETKSAIRTPVPERPSQAEFVRAGEDTTGNAPVVEPNPDEPGEGEPPVSATDTAPEPQATDEAPPATLASPEAPKISSQPPSAGPAKTDKPKSGKPMLLAGVAGGVLIALVGGWFALGGGFGGSKADPELTALSNSALDKPVMPVEGSEAAGAPGFASQMLALVSNGRESGLPAGVTNDLAAAAEQMAGLEAEAKDLPGDSAELRAKQSEISSLSNASLSKFVTAIAANIEGKSTRIAADLPWANPRRAGPASGESSQRQRLWSALRRSRAAVRQASAGIAEAGEPGEAVAFARQALAGARSFAAASGQAYRAGRSGEDRPPEMAANAASNETAQTPEATAGAAAATEQPVAEAQSAGVSSSVRREFESAVSSAQRVAKQVISLGERSRPGSNASDKEKENYALRQQNAKSAKGYQDYLTTLSRSMEATKTDTEARQSTAKARQTLSYLSTLLANSKAAMP